MLPALVQSAYSTRRRLDTPILLSGSPAPVAIEAGKWCLIAESIHEKLTGQTTRFEDRN
jgi:hypothetical protein